MQPDYNLDKIKFATDPPTFERAVGLYEKGKVTDFREDVGGYSAVVMGSTPYEVFVLSKKFDHGGCDCYLGQRGILCKHMVAVAIYAVKKGEELSEKEKKVLAEPEFSGKKGELSKEELDNVKAEITSAMKYIKPYNGPSRIWFNYQNSLAEGTGRLSAIVSEFPASKQTADLLVNLLLRLDKKLCYGGVDDSDGTVGGFMTGLVGVLESFSETDPKCIKSFEKLCNKETCFEWEEPLLEILDKEQEGN